MSEPIVFYKQEKKRFEQQRDLLRKKINVFSGLRLGLFLLASPAAYYSYQIKFLFAGIMIFWIVGFVFLVLRHQALIAQKKLCEQLIRINTVEIDALKGKYSALPEGSEFIDPKHYYSNDIDLFGKGSFFQYLNRTATASGRSTLVQLLLENNPDQIVARQEVLSELSQKVTWRQRFLALAKIVKVEIDHKVIISWIHGYRSFLPKIMTYLPVVFTAVSLLITLLLIVDLVSFYILVIWFFIGLFI